MHWLGRYYEYNTIVKSLTTRTPCFQIKLMCSCILSFPVHYKMLVGYDQ